MRYRLSAKALVIQDGRLLCTANRGGIDEFLLLPGGGQEPFENLHEALARECEEELGTGIGLEIGDLVLVRDYVGRNHEFAAYDQEFHQVELMFACRLAHPEKVGNGTSHDIHQFGVVWVPLAEVAESLLYPKVLRTRIGPEGLRPGPTYLGDVN